MTTSQQTVRTSGPAARLAPVIGTGMLAAALVIGGLAVSRQPAGEGTKPAAAVPTIVSLQFRPQDDAIAAPAPTFDAVKFRAEERGALAPAPTFDAVKFRAEEHTPLVTTPSTPIHRGGTHGIYPR